MSSAGHIFDMIKRVQQNRELQTLRRSKIYNPAKTGRTKFPHIQVPETPYEYKRDSDLSKGLFLFSFVSIISTLGLLIYFILKK